MKLIPTIGALLLAASAVQAQAQPASDQAIGDFVDSHSSVTRLDKIARWEDGVCPSVKGLPPGFTKFILKRVRELAASVGAPVNADEACKVNIDIVFTTAPQALLDSVRASQPVLLGYFDTSAQADRMAVVSRTIQGWHATQTVDLRGKAEIDNKYTKSALAVTGNRLGDGLHSSYYHAIIVANPNQLVEYEIGTLADAIAMVALTQPAQDNACADLPSILDMTNPTCHKHAPAKALTAADTGYLRGLYQANPGAVLRAQKDGIAFRIKEALAAH